MTQVYDDENRLTPVTVIEAGPCPVTQIKSADVDGYGAIQIAFRIQKEQRLSSGELGHLKKGGIEAYSELKEFRTNETVDTKCIDD